MKQGEAHPIYDITPFTLLDYPHKTACILWFAGCNMRCGYCYNPDIVLGKGKKTKTEALTFLHSRRGLLDGVVMSGGECTLHKELMPLAEECKSLGMSVKVDTNGSRPEVLKALVKENTLDYVALDFKAMSSKYQLVTRSNLYKRFEESLEFLITAAIPFEVRTTVHSAQLTAKDIKSMRDFLSEKNYKGSYYLQHFVRHSKTLENLPDSDQNQYRNNLSSNEVRVVMRK